MRPEQPAHERVQPKVATIAMTLAGSLPSEVLSSVTAFLYLADPEAEIAAECIVGEDGRLTLAIHTAAR